MRRHGMRIVRTALVAVIAAMLLALPAAANPTPPTPAAQPNQPLHRPLPGRQGDLKTLPVCEVSYRRLVARLSEQSAALHRFADSVAHTSFARRNQVVDCLRTEIDIGVVFPDHSALLIGNVALNSKVVPCAAWVRAPLSLPFAAAYIDAPIEQDPQQYLAYISAQHAVDQLHRWNGWIVHTGQQLPPGTVYFGFHHRNRTTIYASGNTEHVPGGRDAFLARLAAGDVQTIASIARFASRPPKGQPHLQVFTGMQEVVAAGKPAPTPPSRADQRALAQALARVVHKLADVGQTPPRVALVRLVVNAGTAEIRYENRVEAVTQPRAAADAPRADAPRADSPIPTARPNTRWSWIGSEYGSPPFFGRVAHFAAGCLVLLALQGCVRHAIALARRRKRRIVAALRDPAVDLGTTALTLLSRILARRGVIVFAQLTMAAAGVFAAAVLGKEVRWPLWLALGLLVIALGLAQRWLRRDWQRLHAHADRTDRAGHTAAGIGPCLPALAGQRIAILWHDYEVLVARAQTDDDQRVWEAQKQLRTQLMSIVQGHRQSGHRPPRRLMTARVIAVASLLAVGFAGAHIIISDPPANMAASAPVAAPEPSDADRLPDPMRLAACDARDQRPPPTAIPFAPPAPIGAADTAADQSPAAAAPQEESGSPAAAFAVPRLRGKPRQRVKEQSEGAVSAPPKRTAKPSIAADKPGDDPGYRPGQLPINAALKQ